MAADLLALFSLDKFGCLDFDDVALIDKAQRQDVVDSMDHLFDYLFTAIDYQHITRPKDTALRRDLWTWGHSKLIKAQPDRDGCPSLGVLLSKCMSPSQNVHGNHLCCSNLSG